MISAGHAYLLRCAFSATRPERLSGSVLDRPQSVFLSLPFFRALS